MRDRKATPITTVVPMAAASLAAALLIIGLPALGQEGVDELVARPEVSQAACPLEPIAPVAQDGYRGKGFLRKPPGAGPFPAVVWIHGGLRTRSTETLKEYALYSPPSRFLAAGYVVAVITYRSRDDDPQSTRSRDDSVAAVGYLRQLPYVDPRSIVIYGCSGGGDLALEVAAATDVAAIVPEEPASVLFTGIFNKAFPKQGERFTPRDARPIVADPKRYYTDEYRESTRTKIGKIRCPILILQGDETSDRNRFNAQVLIPELRSAGVTLEVVTYPGEPHCFAFYGSGQRTPRPSVALRAFQDADVFFRRHLRTQPTPVDASLVEHVPVN